MDDARRSQLSVQPAAFKGRGAASYVPGRYAVTAAHGEDDGWGSLHEAADEASRPDTQVTEERARSIVNRNESPDIAFGQSINPYRGCEHGCVYCFARPSHAYLDLSPGLDFETKLYAKTNAAERLRAELARASYRCAPIALGINTDSYQPIERRYRITRSLIEVLSECSHPFSLITKNAGVVRDLDLIAPMARRGLVTVYFSVTTLDNHLSSKMEPRASAPHARLRAMRELADAGVPVGVMAAPMIPMINDAELEHILAAAFEAGARAAGYVVLRLPHELKTIWREWLALHYPDRAEHVMSLVQQMSGGKDYDSTYGTRMRGTGPFAQLIEQRFAKAWRRCGYGRLPALDTAQFVKPRSVSPQGELF
ncbi:PA0069 family radical SAM protein [Lysobacter sp. 5GHs7-4]|uniref:PA0069 family radical SAM protein n=1 Tax=Lysobacter sp. 5GHs7-4 TaxID=2904253 RepID=UPI001E394E4E|nr:PA0069 family radical SAM protein [Lysobacter sp. 5GHs7-4]UHQ23424.1 PA0069 family radical SAM protein [Lysobacter sp. 5GHs7-4]